MTIMIIIKVESGLKKYTCCRFSSTLARIKNNTVSNKKGIK